MNRFEEKVEVDWDALVKACSSLGLTGQSQYSSFEKEVFRFCSEKGLIPATAISGFSRSTVKNIVAGKSKVKKKMSAALAAVFFKIDKDLDITRGKVMKAFYELEFDLRLEVEPVIHNYAPQGKVQLELRDLVHTIHEAKAVATDPNNSDFELNLRVGFERARLALRAGGLRPTANRLIGDLPNTTENDPEYSGEFTLKVASVSPLSWFIDPKIEGAVLDGWLKAGQLAEIEINSGSELVAELSARRDSLKVRVVASESRRTPASVIETHRDKMCAALARRSFQDSADEFVLKEVKIQIATDQVLCR